MALIKFVRVTLYVLFPRQTYIFKFTQIYKITRVCPACFGEPRITEVNKCTYVGSGF